ncbi:hypothetical protein L249_1848 [Ophiocordyceps polyrhachis-furcata BCC 54312]|uniref:Major facilitator superfamily (MFS) profile domain-containing protein n=1 Tax=Ophiocordyceps polyrhachis-furcata BCC 54312 TaxID=1330021 RepID=A0A367LS04_9HYPO|nr:hypothetical protein L249_1848 [Ophiocordyceps polyrhachis-furcata BCC 54312]
MDFKSTYSDTRPFAALDKGPDSPPSSPRLGLKQWLQILSTSVVFTNTWGFLLSSGALQLHYAQSLIPHESSSNISWISTTCAFFVLSSGVVTGPLYDRGYYRALLLGGSLLQVFGLMMLSLSTTYYQLFLCQAICVGVGAGVVFTPSVSAAAAFLPDPATRARAVGLMASGSCIGGVIFPLMFRSLVPQIGFPWTIRSMAFLTFGLYLLSYLVLLDGGLEQYSSPKMRRRFFDSSVLRDPPFLVLVGASLLTAIAYYIPLLYLPIFTLIRIPTVSPSQTIDLLAIINGSSVLGRLSAGLAAAVVGPTEVSSVCLGLSVVILLGWMAVYTFAGTVVWSVFWGMASGVLVTLPGAFVPLFCPSMDVIGTRVGMYWVSAGLGMLIGSPMAGAIHDAKPGKDDAWRLQLFAALFMLGSAVSFLYPLQHLRRKSRKAGPDAVEL